MPWIYVWTSPIKNIYVWTTPVKSVFVGTTKVRPTQLVKTFTTTTTSTLSDAKAIYTSWYKVSKIEVDTTIRFSWNWQMYLRMTPVYSYSSQNLISMTFACNLWGNGWYIQWWKDGSNWTTYQSWWYISTWTDYVVHWEFTLTWWSFTFGWTTTTLSYTSAESSLISNIFNSTTSYVGAAPPYYSWWQSKTLTYTVTYDPA